MYGYSVFLNMQWDLLILQEEAGLRVCLRPKGTSRKVAVSIPDGVIRNLSLIPAALSPGKNAGASRKEAAWAPVPVWTF